MNAAAVAADLSAGFFMYRRVGYDERVMHLLPGGQIGQGSAAREERWSLRLGDGRTVLVILGDDGAVTCDLERESDGVWRGPWLLGSRGIRA